MRDEWDFIALLMTLFLCVGIGLAITKMIVVSRIGRELKNLHAKRDMVLSPLLSDTGLTGDQRLVIMGDVKQLDAQIKEVGKRLFNT